jgi:DNA-directed RNA polymerase subunit N (RpoN/RPB10)
MHIPSVCITCGCPVGDKEDLYLAMRAERTQKILKERGTDVSQAAVDEGLQIECGDILDELAIYEDCCRKTMVTAMHFTDYY